MAKSDAYKQLIAKLPRLPNGADDTRYQAKVDLIKEDILKPLPPVAIRPVIGVRYPRSDAELSGILTDIEDCMKNIHHYLLHAASGQRHAAKFTEVWLTLRTVKDRLAAIESNTNLLLEAYAQLMVEQLECEGTSMHRLDSGEGVTTYLEAYPKIIDPVAFMAYVRADPDLNNKLSLHWSTMRELCGDLLKNGYDVPPGIEVYSKPVVRKLS